MLDIVVRKYLATRYRIEVVPRLKCVGRRCGRRADVGCRYLVTLVSDFFRGHANEND